MLAAVLLFGWTAGCQIPSRLPAVRPNPAAADELRLVDLDLARAVQAGDAARMEAILHPGYSVHLANGRLVDRAQTMALVRDGSLARERFSRTIESVLVVGDTGVVMGVDRLEAPPPLAQRGERTRRYTNVYVRDGSRWSLVARHFHLIP